MSKNPEDTYKIRKKTQNSNISSVKNIKAKLRLPKSKRESPKIDKFVDNLLIPQS